MAVKNKETQTVEHLVNNTKVAEEASAFSENSEQKNENEVEILAPNALKDEFCVD